MARIVTTVLLLATSATSLRAQQGYPIELDQGPLACFSVTVSSTPHHVDLYAANCDGERVAKPFWRNAGNTRVVARLGQSRLLIASYGEPYALIVIDTKTGKHRVLAEGSPHSFVAVHGDDVLYLGDNRWGKGEHHLFARSWREVADRRQLAEPLFHAIPIVRGNLAIGIAAGEREVWAISLTRGDGRKICDIPEHGRQVRLALSPGAQRLAIGASVTGRGYLAVADLGSSKLLQTWQDLEIDVAMLSSSIPTVEVGWFDEEHVVSSETIGPGRGRGEFAFVRRSIETGKVTEESSYGPVELNHRTPPRPHMGDSAAKEPAFAVHTDGEQLLLMKPGQKQPVTTVPRDYRSGFELHLAPDGAFAIVQHTRAPKRITLYRPKNAPLVLSETGGSDWRWLPAAGNVGSHSK